LKREIIDGTLYIDGCSAVSLAEEFGTPLYVMSESAITQRIQELKEGFINKYPNVRVAYAAKAFCTLAMCRLCHREGIGIDVVSGGELYTAIKAGFPPEAIEFNGNNKLPEEIEMAVDYGIGRFIVDGLQELSLIEKICKAKGKKANILFRITPGVDADTHDYMVTGRKDSNFGIPLDDDVIYPQIERAIESEYINFLGFHFHIGSQIFQNEGYLYSLDIVLGLAEEVEKRFGCGIKELNIGGGFGASYTDEERKPYSYFLGPVMGKIQEFYKAKGSEIPAVVIEPGRSIVAEAGVSLYTIGSIKDIKGVRKYISVDGGMTDNLRPALYGAEYRGVVANKLDSDQMETVTIAGKCCESGDILIKDIEIAKDAEAGDIFAIFTTGAYGYSMANNYNRNPIPAVVFVNNGQASLAVRRQTYDQIIENDL
jgi:diaminopimelate decarboxylase